MADITELFFAPLAREIVNEILGPNCLKMASDDFEGHPVWVVDHPPTYDIDAVMPELRTRLDKSGWQVMTVHLADEPRLAWFAFAPIWVEQEKTIYHATPTHLVSAIFRHGLLPSNEARSLTNYPDTLGKIHGSRALFDRPGIEDGATRWRDEFSKKYGVPFSLIEVDLTNLPQEARLYRDIHSAWGLVVDRVNCIPPSALRLVDDAELRLAEESGQAA